MRIFALTETTGPLSNLHREPDRPGTCAAFGCLCVLSAQLTRRCSAASSGAAASHALTGLATLLSLTLGKSCVSQYIFHEQLSGESAGHALQSICRSADAVNGSLVTCVDQFDHVATTTPPQPASMRVKRDEMWVSDVAGKCVFLACADPEYSDRAHTLRLKDLLPSVFFAVQSHPRSTVRMAAARCSYLLLVNCSVTLPACAGVCLETLLILSQDPWPQVASLASSLLSKIEVSNDASEHIATTAVRLEWPFLRTLLEKQVSSFGCSGGHSVRGLLCTGRVLVGLITLAGPVRAVEAVLSSHSKRRLLCTQLLRAFRVESPALSSLAGIEVRQAISTTTSADVNAYPPFRCADLSLLVTAEVRSC